MANIYTHCDFDGLISAILLSRYFPNYNVIFETPNSIYKKQITIHDIVADLPYPRSCKLWFDHHRTNMEEINDRNIKILDIPGFWKEEKSAAQVIYEYYKASFSSQDKTLVNAANIIDAMDYRSVEDWKKETPEKIINEAITIKQQTFQEMQSFLFFLFEALKEQSLVEVSKLEKVQKRYWIAKNDTDKDKLFLTKVAKFVDKNKKILVLDYTNLSHPPRIEKNLSIELFPECDFVVALSCQYNRGRKTNDVKVSVGKNFLKQKILKQDLGAYFSEQNIGGGHQNAAGAILFAKTKKERERKIQDFIEDFIDFWKEG